MVAMADDAPRCPLYWNFRFRQASNLAGDANLNTSCIKRRQTRITRSTEAPLIPLLILFKFEINQPIRIQLLAHFQAQGNCAKS